MTDRQTTDNRKTDTDRQTNRQTDRQADDRQTDRQMTDRQTNRIPLCPMIPSPASQA